MNSAKYHYVSRNLLDDPEYYHFSAYSGLEFLNGYRRVRQQAIQSLEVNYLQLLRNGVVLDLQDNVDSLVATIWSSSKKLQLSLSQEVHDLHASLTEKLTTSSLFEKQNSGQVPEFGTNESISTPGVLSAILLQMLNKQNFEQERIYDWLSCLLKRFEITKKLFGTYSPQLKPIDPEDYKKLSNYALLSLCLINYYGIKQNLKMLNSTLKINDLLISNVHRLQNPAELFFTLLSLRWELDVIDSLAKDKGVI